MGFSKMSQTVHIVGAGLAGLSAAVSLAGRGIPVIVHEATSQGGGRCRSYYDEVLACRIDNGNHLMLSGNSTILGYLKTIGADETMIFSSQPEFPFLDLSTGQRWSVKLNKGIIQWSLFSSKNRVPGSSISEYLRGLSLAWAGPDKTVSQCLKGKGTLFEKFWDPMAVSVMNTETDTASAQLLWPVLRETFGRGGKACVPMIVRDGLSESFVDPALDYIKNRGGLINFNHRLHSIERHQEKITKLIFNDEKIPIEGDMRVILAVPPSVASFLLPEISAPDEYRPIVNGHFQIPEKVQPLSFLGLVGGTSHWLFVRKNLASITVSSATDLVSKPNEEIAGRLWADICTALELGDSPLKRHRIIKEKRATFAQTPDQLSKRPVSQTKWINLNLAGDWTATGLPATIEGTLRSGYVAANASFS
jgi:squalene-associated FAD-dependent desaturase